MSAPRQAWRPGFRLERHSDWVSALCVLPDGRLASGSHDRTIRLWDVATGAETVRLEADALLSSSATPSWQRPVRNARNRRLTDLGRQAIAGASQPRPV